MAKVYRVTVPVAGAIEVWVRADSEEEAEDKVFNGDLTIHVKAESEQFEDVYLEWDMFKRLTSGNVLYAPINNVSIELEEEEEDDE